MFCSGLGSLYRICLDAVVVHKRRGQSKFLSDLFESVFIGKQLAKLSTQVYLTLSEVCSKNLASVEAVDKVAIRLSAMISRQRAGRNVEHAEAAGKGIDFVRVDIYDSNRGPLIDEMTCFPEASTGRFSPPCYDDWLGAFWKFNARG